MTGDLLRRGRETRDALVQRDGHVKRHQEGGHLREWERGLGKNKLC